MEIEVVSKLRIPVLDVGKILEESVVFAKILWLNLSFITKFYLKWACSFKVRSARRPSLGQMEIVVIEQGETSI